jgi:small conductance mechanosensitive channel
LRILTKILLGLLLAGILGSSSFAASEVSEDARSVQMLLDTLDKNITAQRFLMEQIETEKSVDREVLVYRQDERTFRLLEVYDAIATKVAALPEDSQQKQDVAQQLTELGTDLDAALFNRIDEIKQQVIKHNAQLNELSGATRVAAQAYVHGMESIRIRYYEALANHIQSRDVLGLSSEKLRGQLAPKLYYYAETLVGRIEITSAARENVQDRLSSDPDNTDIDRALKDLNARHDTNILRLEAIILILDHLELDSSEYQAVMLQQASNISVSFFSSSAIIVVLQDSWRTLRGAIEENAPDLIFKILLFFAVLLIFRTLSRLTKRLVRAASDKSKLDMSALLKDILVSTSGGFVMALGVLMALSQVGISLAPMLAGLGVAGFIVGFALQDSLGNFAAGAMILIYRPFDVDDFVEVTGASGLVKKMNLVSTTILTFDNQTLVVPNSKIWGDVIKNVTAQKERRVDLEFGIGYNDDIELAEKVLAEIVSAHEKVLTDPAPTIKLHTLGDSSVNFIVRPWTKTEDYWDVYWDLMREVKLRFDSEGISIPFPQRDVHLYSK